WLVTCISVMTIWPLSIDMTLLQAQLSLIQREGVKSFNLVLKQVGSAAAEPISLTMN
ncbi:hypothetical protein HAX54_016704, partial [Datura stramonium]|nr:hypothetical protein [Datura stramonium]